VVAEELSFTRAAQRLHISQPSLSVLIQGLERQIDTALFIREGRNIRLSEAGEVFLKDAYRLMAQSQESIERARRAARGEIGHLSVGYSNPAGFRILPTLVPAFSSARPEVEVTFHDLHIPQQLEKLRRDELDIAFVWMPVEADDLDVCELLREPLIAVLPAGHRLARAKQVTIKNLANEPLILPVRSLDPQSIRQIERMFDDAAVTMRVRYELDTLLSMVNFVAMGSGCSILPGYVQKIPREGVAYKPLKARIAFKTLAIVKRKGRGGLPEEFFKFTAAHVKAATRPTKQ
jgi:DNA-binding transcriptional LysR family regulator